MIEIQEYLKITVTYTAAFQNGKGGGWVWLQLCCLLCGILLEDFFFSTRLDVHKHLMQPEVQRTTEEPFLFLLEQTKNPSYSRKG